MNASQIPRENLQLALLKDRRERILYTYKAHEKAADRADRIHCCRRVASILLTSVSVTTFATSLSGIIASQESASLMISFVALLATVVSLVSDYFNFDAESREHVRVASRLRYIFQGYESLICDIAMGLVTPEEALRRRDALALKEEEILESVQVRTGRRSYKRAMRALEGDEKVTGSEEG